MIRSMSKDFEASDRRVAADHEGGIPSKTIVTRVPRHRLDRTVYFDEVRDVVPDFAEIAQRRCLAMSCAEVVRTMAEDYSVEIVFTNDGRARALGVR